MSNYLDFDGGLRRRTAIATSAGAADANRLIRANSGGRLDPSFIERVNLAQVSSDFPLFLPGGRLTLSNVFTVSDQSDATTLYYLPQETNICPLRESGTGRWIYRTFTSVSLSLENLTPDTNYDIYAQASGNGISLGAESWSSDSARAVSLVQKNRVRQINRSDLNFPTYLGTIRVTGTVGAARGQDSVTQRFVYNAYNRFQRRFQRLETAASWTYNSSTWRAWNNSTANRVELVDGLVEEPAELLFLGRATRSSPSTANYGIGLNSTTTPTVQVSGGVGESNATLPFYRTLSLGYNFVQLLESVQGGTANLTFFGTNLGVQGLWRC